MAASLLYCNARVLSTVARPSKQMAGGEEIKMPTADVLEHRYFSVTGATRVFSLTKVEHVGGDLIVGYQATGKWFCHVT